MAEDNVNLNQMKGDQKMPSHYQYDKIQKAVYEGKKTNHDSGKACFLKKDDQTNQFIKVKDGILPPIASFDELTTLANVSPYVSNLLNTKFPKGPTPIQSQSWPFLFAGHDTIGIARTGSGKTLSFVIPVIQHIYANYYAPQAPSKHVKRTAKEGPIAMIVAPNRELANQIHDVFQQYNIIHTDHGARKSTSHPLQETTKRHTQQHNDTITIEDKPKNAVITSTVIVGGQNNRKQQIHDLFDSPDVLIGTPGRLLDFLSMDVFRLWRCSMVVLDEADYMLSLGFATQVKNILDSIVHPQRKLTMFSATWNEVVQEFAASFLREPIAFVAMATSGDTTLASSSIQQDVLMIRKSPTAPVRTHYNNVSMMEETVKDPFYPSKMEQLLHLFEQYPTTLERVLIFVNHKETADLVRQDLCEAEWPAVALHASRNQQAREWVLASFSTGDIPILVSTDVVARGIDVDHISLVINFDMPSDFAFYVHRIGRTGRAGAKGHTISFFSRKNLALTNPLIQYLLDCKQTVPPPLLQLQHVLNKKKK